MLRYLSTNGGNFSDGIFNLMAVTPERGNEGKRESVYQESFFKRNVARLFPRLGIESGPFFYRAFTRGGMGRYECPFMVTGLTP
jgi:hypothetical protein